MEHANIKTGMFFLFVLNEFRRGFPEDCVRGCALSACKRISVLTVLMAVSVMAAAENQVTFTSQTYPLTQAPSQLLTADFNGDGRPDLAVLSLNGGTVSILLTKADGSLSAERDFPAITPEDPCGCGSSFNGFAVGDVNGDGKLDLVLADSANPAGPSINVLFGNGDGTFEPAIVTVMNFLVQADAFIGVADFNADHKLDVALFGYDGTSLGPFAMLGNGDGTFTPGPIAAVGFGPIASAVADVNGDGKPDLVFTNLNFNNLELLVFLGNGDGTFSPQPSAPSPAAGLVMGDFNHDGKTDLAQTSLQGEECEFGVCHATGPIGSLAVLLGVGNGTFGGPGVLESGNYGFAATGDFDGDSNLDLVASVSPVINPAASVIMLGDGQGHFSSQSAVSVPNTTSGMVSADFNGDGLADLALLLNSGLQIELNTTPGFSLTTSGLGSGISPGGSTTFTINVGQQNGFTSSVTFGCSSLASAGISCSFSPSSVTPGGSTTLTVTTTAASSARVWPLTRSHSKPLYALWLPIGAVFLGGIRIAEARWRKRLAALLLAGLLISVLILQLACGGGGTGSSKIMGTPAGTYTVSITGTSGSLQRSTTVTVTVE